MKENVAVLDQPFTGVDNRSLFVYGGAACIFLNMRGELTLTTPASRPYTVFARQVRIAADNSLVRVNREKRND